MLTEKIKLYLNSDNIYTTIYSKQGDKGTRFVEGELYFNNIPYTPSPSSIVIVSISKPDGTKVVCSSADENPIISLSGSKVTFELTEQMLGVAGIAIGDISLIEGVGILSTAIFKNKISPKAVSDTAVASADQYNILVDALDRTENIDATFQATNDEWDGKFLTKYNLWDADFSNQYGQITNQFADKATAIDTEFAEKYDTLEATYATDLTTVKTGLAEKVSQVYVDTKVASVANGSPKATFSTLALLQADTTANTADGKKSIYLVTADGKWYYWNGTAWTGGGTYQSTGIASGSVAEEKLDLNLATKINQGKLLYEFMDEATVEASAQSGAIVSIADRTITIPIGQTGNNSFLKFKQAFNSAKYVGYTLRIHCQYALSTPELNYTKVSIGLNIMNSVMKYPAGINTKTTAIGTNRYNKTTDYVIASGDVGIYPYPQLYNTVPLVEEEKITIERISYEIIPISTQESIPSSTIIMNEKLSLLNNKITALLAPITTNIFTTPAVNTSKVFDVSKYETVYLEVITFHAGLIKVNGQLPDLSYTPINLINIDTGNGLSYVSHDGLYQIYVKGFTSIRFDAIFSQVGGGNLVANMKIYPTIPRLPRSILGNPQTKFNEVSVLNEINNTSLVYAVKENKLYTVSGNVVKTSSDWGNDNYSTIVGTIPLATNIYKLLVLDNGNALAIDVGGKMYLSIDNFVTWSMVHDFGVKPPHTVFGSNSYKNFVLMSEYSTTKIPLTAKNVWLSQDYGVTWNSVFDISNFFTEGSHVHSSCYDPYEGIIWVLTGDSTQAVLFYSKDLGVTWYRSKPSSRMGVQCTEIIPLKNCVLFISDDRMTSAVRYNRPMGGTMVGQSLSLETADIFVNGWGKDNGTEVPIAARPAIDYDNNVAYFGYALAGNAPSGCPDGSSLLYGDIYQTDGYVFKKAFKHSAIISNGIKGVYIDTDNKVVVAFSQGNIGAVRLG